MNIYDIKKELTSILEAVEANDGELTDDLEAQLDKCQLERADKIVQYIKWYKNEYAKKAIVDAEIKKLKKISETKGRLTDRIFNLIKNNVDVGEKIGDEIHKLQWRPSEIVVVDETQLDSKYFKIEKTPLKADIKEQLKNGIIIFGAKLEKRLNMGIK